MAAPPSPAGAAPLPYSTSPALKFEVLAQVGALILGRKRLLRYVIVYKLVSDAYPVDW